MKKKTMIFLFVILLIIICFFGGRHLKKEKSTTNQSDDTIEVTTEENKPAADDPIVTATDEVTTIESSTTETTTTEATTTEVTTTEKVYDFVAEYEIRSGDTLYQIAEVNGISLEELLSYNNLTENSTIYSGDIILLPGVETAKYPSYAEEGATINSFSTTLTTTGADENSWFNIELACSSLNGLVIGPGESFSWADYMGPNDSSQGYKEATIYLNGETSKAAGGGVCMVSTTLMQGARGSGCVITEKHDHSKPVSYAGRGDEASVSWGSWDLQFYNPSPTQSIKFALTPDASTHSVSITTEVF